MIRIAGAAVVMALGVPAAAQNAIGDWTGQLNPQLRVVVHIGKPNEGSGLIGTLDSPDQGVAGLTLANVRADGDELHFDVPAVKGTFAGSWVVATKTWSGRWSQAGSELPLTLMATKLPEPSALLVAKNWKMPDSAQVKVALDKAVNGRPGIAFAAALVSPSKTEVTISGPATTATMFEIGSLTKLFTGLLLADMAAKREVTLDDPVRRYLPAGTLADNGNRPITLRDLASHISGLPRLPTNISPGDQADPYADYDEAKMFAFLKTYVPTRLPGAQFEYSNFGAGLLGYILGRAAGRPYVELLSDRILRPLGMTETCIGRCTNRALAEPHDAGGKAVKPWSFDSLAGAGAIRSSAADMARFAGALADPPEALKPAVDLMLAKRTPIGGKRGIGLAIFTVPTTEGEILFHDGATAGSQSSLAVNRKSRRAVVVLTNSGGKPTPGPIALKFLAGFGEVAEK